MAKIWFTKPGKWGRWYRGDRYDMRLGDVKYYDEAGSHTRVEVEILDKATGRIHQRVGDGKQIGNFHQIWVNFKGRKVQVDSLLASRR